MSSSKIRERIRRLREMTSARGCTEAEAISAAEKAARLMRDHGLSEADIVMDESQASRAARGRSVKAQLWPIIAACTNTSPLLCETTIAFIGKTPGPDIACYLRDICERAIDRAVREFKTTTFYRRRRGLPSKRAAVADFTQGMVNRLGNRLWDIFGPHRDDASAEAAIAARDERYPWSSIVEAKRGPLRHLGARIEGWRAGEAVTLAHGVGRSASPLAIGRNA